MEQLLLMQHYIQRQVHSDKENFTCAKVYPENVKEEKQ